MLSFDSRIPSTAPLEMGSQSRRRVSESVASIEPSYQPGIQGRRRLIVVGCFMLVAVNGVAISVLPHFVRYFQAGDLAFVSDPDDLIYVANGTRAFYGRALGNRDLPTGNPPGMLPFVGTAPFVHFARMFWERPLSVLFIWRFWAGLSMSIGLFVLRRSYFQSEWPAFLTALLLPCDAGWLMCRPGIQNLLMGWTLWTHPDATIARGGSVHWQLRVISPATLIVWLLLYFWLLGRARSTGQTVWVVLAGISLGLLCDAYFFFATTAALGLLLLLIFDSGHLRTYLKVGIISTITALPIVFNIWHARQAMIPEAVNRLGIAADLTDGLDLPRMAILALLIGGISAFRKRREMLPIWCFALAGLLLYNSHLLTGVDFQHAHWRAYALMPIASLMLLIVGFDVVTSIKPSWLLRTAVTTAVLVSITAGYYLRVEASVRPNASTRSDRAVSVRDTAEVIAPWSTVAGPSDYLTYAAVTRPLLPLYEAIVFHSSFIGENELSERRALNEILMGTSADAYRLIIDKHLETYPFGDAASNSEVRQEISDMYVETYDEILRDFPTAMDNYNVRYLAIPVDDAPPAIIASHCELMKSSDVWSIYEINLPERTERTRSEGVDK